MKKKISIRKVLYLYSLIQLEPNLFGFLVFLKAKNKTKQNVDVLTMLLLKFLKDI